MHRNSYPWARRAGRTPEWVQPAVAPVEPPSPAQGTASLNARIDGWTRRFQERMRSSSRFFVWCLCLFVILNVALDGVLWNVGRSDKFCTWYLVGLVAICCAAAVPARQRFRQLVREERRKAGQCLSCGYAGALGGARSVARERATGER